MKKTFLRKIPITWLLILFFSTILILLITAEITEHKEFKQTQLNLNEITIKSLHRQQILTSILEQSVYTRVNTLNALLNPEKGRSLDSALREKILINDQHHLEYQKLIEGPIEQELFNQTQLLRKLNINAYQNIQHTNKAQQKQLSQLFENFQQANRTLADFVKKRDAKKIEKANFQLSEIEKLGRFNNIVLALMLTGLGIVILRTVMILRKKNWKLAENERKYRGITRFQPSLMKRTRRV